MCTVHIYNKRITAIDLWYISQTMEFSIQYYASYKPFFFIHSNGAFNIPLFIPHETSNRSSMIATFHSFYLFFCIQVLSFLFSYILVLFYLYIILFYFLYLLLDRYKNENGFPSFFRCWRSYWFSEEKKIPFHLNANAKLKIFLLFSFFLILSIYFFLWNSIFK